MKRTRYQVVRQGTLGIVVMAASALMSMPHSNAQAASKTSAKKTVAKSTLNKRSASQSVATQTLAQNTIVNANSSAATQTNTQTQLSTQIQTKTEQKRKTDLKWKVSTEGRQWENANERVQFAGFGVNFDFNHSINENFSFKAVTGATMRSGYVHTRFGEMSARSSIWLAEGYLQGTVGSVLTLRGGVINQGIWDMTQINDGAAFPGLLEKIKFGDDYYIELMAGQSIPVAHDDMATRTTGAEPTPAFMVESLKIGLEPKDAWLTVNAFGGHWAYHNLPNKVAGDSEVGGNNLIEIDNKTKQFKYRFEGWFAGTSGQLNFTKRTNLEAHLQISQNTQAPEAYGASQIAGGSLTVGLPSNVDLRSGVDFFFAESDASPAYYNSTAFGHNNRNGLAVSLSANFKDHGFKVSGLFTDADVINPHPLQERQQLYILKFETNYAAL